MVEQVDLEKEQSRIIDWLRTVLKGHEKIQSRLDALVEQGFQEGLCDGVILCHLMLEIDPYSIPRIHDGVLLRNTFKKKENVIYFLGACEDFGLTRWQLFDIDDLFVGRNPRRVVECILILGKRLANDSAYAAIPKLEVGRKLEAAQAAVPKTQSDMYAKFSNVSGGSRGKLGRLNSLTADSDKALKRRSVATSNPAGHGVGRSLSSLLEMDAGRTEEEEKEKDGSKGEKTEIKEEKTEIKEKETEIKEKTEIKEEETEIKEEETEIKEEETETKEEKEPTKSKKSKKKKSLSKKPKKKSSSLRKDSSKHHSLPVFAPVEAPGEPEVSAQPVPETQKIQAIVSSLDEPQLARLSKQVSRMQAIFRGIRGRRMYRKKVRDLAFRSNVAQEILASERTYVNDLKAIYSVWLEPLKASAQTSKALISSADLKTIFGDVEVILSYNTHLLSELEPRLAAWSHRQRLGDIFIKITAFLKVYSQYVNNFNNSLQTLDRCRKKKVVEQFFVDAMESPAAKTLDIGAFLIQPVQRIPRYEMLLKELVRYTEKDHPDYKNLLLAKDKIQEVATYVNQKKREAENISKVLEIEKRFVSLQKSLALPHRRFVYEGVLTTLKPKKKEMVCILFNDMVVWAKKAGNSKKRPAGGDMVKENRRVEIDLVNLVPVGGTQGAENCLKFEEMTPTGMMQETVVSVPDPKEKGEWLLRFATVLESRKAMQSGEKMIQRARVEAGLDGGLDLLTKRRSGTHNPVGGPFSGVGNMKAQQNNPKDGRKRNVTVVK